VDTPADALARLDPPLRPGERVSVRVGEGPDRREVLGYVTAVSAERVHLVDRRGRDHDLARADVSAARRVGVSLGRNPAAAPRALLDGLAARAGAVGTPWVARISDLLADRTPPAAVPPWGDEARFGGTTARAEGEWGTLGGGSADVWVDAAWWATRMGARSVQVRTDDPELEPTLRALGFVRL